MILTPQQTLPGLKKLATKTLLMVSKFMNVIRNFILGCIQAIELMTMILDLWTYTGQ